MLVLKRKKGQTLKLSGGITVTVTEIGRGFVRLGIEAPVSISVSRPDARNQEPRCRPDESDMISRPVKP
jgi:carbon storage regulator CsrA